MGYRLDETTARKIAARFAKERGTSRIAWDYCFADDGTWQGLDDAGFGLAQAVDQSGGIVLRGNQHDSTEHVVAYLTGRTVAAAAATAEDARARLIRQVREGRQAGDSVAQLAQDARVSRQTIYTWLAG